MSALFLHGGGDLAACRAETFGRFVAAAASNGPAQIGMVVVEEQADQIGLSVAAYSAIFTALGLSADQLIPLAATPSQPLTSAQLAAQPLSALFVCGGMTPLYHAALCADQAWVDYLNERQLPYGGTSAGAAIAARHAILGGWLVPGAEPVRSLVFQGASEGLDLLTVKPGLALTNYAVEVHASQMGTLARLAHAVDQRLVAAGWALDENTQLEVRGASATVHGLGQVYQVWRAADDSIRLAIHAAGVQLALDAA